MTKKELSTLYKISYNTLRKLLNVRYFEALSEVGYIKSDRILSPNVINKFFEIYGKPISDLD